MRDSACVPCLELVLHFFLAFLVGGGVVWLLGLFFVLVFIFLCLFDGCSKGCLTPSYHLQRASRPFRLHRSLYFVQTRATRAQTAAE